MSNKVGIFFNQEEHDFQFELLRMFGNYLAGLPIDICTCEEHVEIYQDLLARTIRASHSFVDNTWKGNYWEEVEKEQLKRNLGRNLNG